MNGSTHKRAAIGLAAIGLAVLMTSAAQAATPLPVTNLQFNQINGSFSNTPTKDFFTTVAPTGWSSGSSPGLNSNLTYVGKQGSEGTGIANPNIYPVYTPSPFSVTVPAGTNFFQADGNPTFEDTIYQTIHGLVAGTTYTLQFQQAAGQQVGFTGATTEQWKVFLGVGGIGTNCSTDPCTVTGLANNIEQDSTLMNTASQGMVDWNSVTLSFTPTAANLTAGGDAILTFLAWGDSGHTSNLPPTVFLEGVNTPPIQTPEPATLTLFAAGAMGVGYVRRRRAQRKAKA